MTRLWHPKLDERITLPVECLWDYCLGETTDEIRLPENAASELAGIVEKERIGLRENALFIGRNVKAAKINDCAFELAPVTHL